MGLRGAGMGAARGSRTGMQSCRVLGEPPGKRGAAATEHFAAQPQLPGRSRPGWRAVQGSPRRRQGQPQGGSQLCCSRSPCLGCSCSRAIKGSVGRALELGPLHRGHRAGDIPGSCHRELGLGARAAPGAVGPPCGGDALGLPQPDATLQNSLCLAGPGKGPGSPCPHGQAPTPTPVGAQGAGERVRLVRHGHGQSRSRSHSPGKGLAAFIFSTLPRAGGPGLLLSTIVPRGVAVAVAVHGTGRAFAAETNSGGVADAKTWESEGPGESGTG